MRLSSHHDETLTLSDLRIKYLLALMVSKVAKRPQKLLVLHASNWCRSGSEVSVHSRLIISRQQFINPVDLVVCDVAEGIGEPCLWVDAVKRAVNFTPAPIPNFLDDGKDSSPIPILPTVESSREHVREALSGFWTDTHKTQRIFTS